MQKYSCKSVFILVLAALFLCTTNIYADFGDSSFVKLEKAEATAKSTLQEKGKPDSFYGALNALDEDMKTAWCSAKKDLIKGEYFALELNKPKRAEGFAFFQDTEKA